LDFVVLNFLLLLLEGLNPSAEGMPRIFSRSPGQPRLKPPSRQQLPFQLILLILKQACPGGLLRLALKSANLGSDFGKHVRNAKQILFGPPKLMEGLLFSGLVFRYSSRFVQECPAFQGTAVDDGINSPLFHHTVAICPNAGVQKKGRNVAKPRGLAVENILTVTISVQATPNGYLVEIDRQVSLRIVQNERDFGNTGRSGRCTPIKEYIAHPGSAQTACTLFSQHPADTVEYIRLSTTIRTNHHRHSRMEVNGGPVGKALEAVDFEPLEKPHQAGGTILGLRDSI
jgi:hypothetical protein